MKNAAFGAALLGLLFVGCTTTQPQDPPAEQERLGEAGRFVWSTGTTTGNGIQARVELDSFNLPELPLSAGRQDPPSFRDVLRGKVGQQCDVQNRVDVWTLTFPTHEAEAQERVKQEVEARLKVFADIPQFMREQVQAQLEADLLRELRQGTLAAVGQDFVQLREADGTERFIPLSRVDVVVRPDGAGRAGREVALRRARADVTMLKNAIDMYLLQTRARELPTLDDLITPDERGRLWLEGYSEPLTDPWGNEYEIRPGERGGRDYEVLCWGPDGRPDTADDITSHSEVGQPVRRRSWTASKVAS